MSMIEEVVHRRRHQASVRRLHARRPASPHIIEGNAFGILPHPINRPTLRLDDVEAPVRIGQHEQLARGILLEVCTESFIPFRYLLNVRTPSITPYGLIQRQPGLLLVEVPARVDLVAVGEGVAGGVHGEHPRVIALERIPACQACCFVIGRITPKVDVRIGGRSGVLDDLGAREELPLAVLEDRAASPGRVRRVHRQTGRGLVRRQQVELRAHRTAPPDLAGADAADAVAVPEAVVGVIGITAQRGVVVECCPGLPVVNVAVRARNRSRGWSGHHTFSACPEIGRVHSTTSAARLTR
mmetsp:Transcript_98415/g.273765  ORF Transcript_98415/g.273765 Transcript_98415/m.273765 type:complete len:298 (-) Transcript_98415:510-1403(-)